MHVDAPTGAENRQLNEIEFTRNSFELNKSQVTDARGNATLSDDMTPSGFPGGFVSGVYEPVEGEIPLHQNSRVRVSCVIPPVLATAVTNYTSSWGDEPWFMQHFGMALHMLEEVY